MRIELGDVARDKITGFEGVVVARTTWLTGCDRLTLQPEVDKDGKVPDGVSFDEPYLELVTRGKVKPEVREEITAEPDGAARRTGGPRPEPTRSVAAR